MRREIKIANTFMLLLVLISALIVWGVIIYVVYLLIVALRKYIKSEPVRKEKEEYAKTLGGVIKKHRSGICGRNTWCI